ncbi:MAG: tetratricopeptide repeat protein, partial [Dokdonella sp.]
GRLLRRYRWAVAATSVLILSLGVGLASTVWQARRAQNEAERANAVRDFLVSLFETAEADKPRDLRPTPEEIVESGGDRILADRDMPLETRADLLAVLARVAVSMGANAQPLTAALLPMSDELYEQTDPRWIRARSLHALALLDDRHPAQVVQLLEPLREDLLRRGGAPAIEVLLTLSNAMSQQGAGSEEVLALQREVSELAMRDAQSDPRSAFQALISEAEHLAALHRFKESVQRAEFALEFQKANSLPLSKELVRLHGSIGNSASSLGDVARGEAAYREAIALSERMYGRPHRDTAWFVGLLGSYLVSLGRLAEAEPYVQRGLTMRRDLLGDAHPDTLFAMAALARLRAAQNRMDEALTVLSEGVSTCTRTALLHDACVRVLQTRGRMYAVQSKFAFAEADLNAAIALQRKVSGEDGAMVASQFAHLADLQRRMGRYDETIVTANYSLDLFDKAGGGHWGDVAIARSQRAWANLELGRVQDALAEITEVESAFSERAAGNLPVRIGMLSVRARALSKSARNDEAKLVAAEALTLVEQAPATDAAMVAGLERLARTGQGY